MSFKSEDLLNLSLELAKESSNRIVENQKLKILNLKEKKNREINEERMIKYFEENYNKINERIDDINDEINNIHEIMEESKDSLQKSDSLINNKMIQIEEEEKSMKEKVELINKKIEEQYLLETNDEDYKEEIVKVQNEISLIEKDIDTNNKKIMEYKTDLENLRKAKIAFEISFYLDNIKNNHNILYSKADGFKTVYKNSIELMDSNKNIYNDFENLISKNTNLKDNLDNYSRVIALKDENNKKFQVNDIERIKLSTAKLEIDNIVKNIKNLTTDDFETPELTKIELEKSTNTLEIMEKYLTNVQEIYRNLIEINQILKNNFINLQDMIKQILISQNQKETLDKKMKDLEDKFQYVVSKESNKQSEDLIVSKLNQKISELENKLNDLQKKTIINEENNKKVDEIVQPVENTEAEKSFESFIKNMESIENIAQQNNSSYQIKNLYHILKRTPNKTETNIDIDDFNKYSPKDINVLIEKAKTIDKELKGFETNYSTYGIKMEEKSIDSKNISSENIGTIVNANYKFNNIKIYGQGVKNQFIFKSESNVTNIKNFTNIESTDNVISIFDKNTALKLASIFYSNMSEIDAEFCYYSSNRSEQLIPSYRIFGKIKDSELIDTFIPANLEYVPLIKFTEIDVNAIENENNIEFELTFQNLKSVEKVQLISSFGNHYLSKNKVSIIIPKNVTKNILESLKYIDVALSSINIYGFNYNISLIIDFSKYIGLFKIIEMGDIFEKVHNYGVEWGEADLGGAIFSNYINIMDSYGIHKEYTFNSQLSKERNFIDSNASGLDNRYVDNVDTLAYIGHGSGDGITFLTSDNDNKLTNSDAEQGNAWGNKNLEFMALMSCQVLKETHNGVSWADRWGGVFNGLHLLCGFQTNANTGEHMMLGNFANNQYGNKMTVLNAWLNAANLDQPSGRQAVVMGPLIQNSRTDLYNSKISSIPSLYRAYWNDKAWGVENGPGNKVFKNDIKGWWRIVFTV